MPVSGSFSTFADRFVDPAFGFAMGWNYWFNWAITVAVEAATVGVVMGYWLPNVPSWIWSALVLILITVINLMSARSYAETEFWMATIKVVAVVAFLVMVRSLIDLRDRIMATIKVVHCVLGCGNHVTCRLMVTTDLS